MEETKQTKVTNEQIMEYLVLQNKALTLIVNVLSTLIIHNDSIHDKEKAIANIALQGMVEELKKTCGLIKRSMMI